jgi:hypothetical protein
MLSASYAQYINAEFFYAECRCAECRGAVSEAFHSCNLTKYELF